MIINNNDYSFFFFCLETKETKIQEKVIGLHTSWLSPSFDFAQDRLNLFWPTRRS
jgi:hypothetical protein